MNTNSLQDPIFAGGRPPVFAGHSDYLTALAGYDMKSVLYAMMTGAIPGEPVVPNADLGAAAGLAGGLFEVLALPPGNQELPGVLRTEKRLEDDEVPQLERHYALDKTLAGIAALFKTELKAGSRVKLVRSVEELRKVQAAGKLAAVLHLADADAIDTELETLYVLYEAGLRSLAITWSRRNAFGYGVPYRSLGSPDIGPSLTEAGIRLVQACNELGILIDLAHLNEAGFWDVAKHSKAPLVVTHGAAHALSPTSRALTDRQLAAIAKSKGLVGVSLEGVKPSPSGIVNDMVCQIQYLIERLGTKGVALGSDLYRKPDRECPGGKLLLPDLLTVLQKAGCDQDLIVKITYANWLRVLEATW